MLVGKPILAGESDNHQLEIIFDLCGTPTESTMPGWKSLPGAEVLEPRPRPGNLSHRFRESGSGAISLLKELLRLDWRTRINAIDALQHPYFRNSPLPANPSDLPSFEESHELDRRKFQDRKAALPPAPKGGAVGLGALEGGTGPNSSFGNADGYGRRNGANSGRYPRNGPPPPADERRPAWHREKGLPPRPPPPIDYGNGWDPVNEHFDGHRGRDGDRPPPRRPPPGAAARADVDTYIPSYDREGGRREPRDDRRRRDDWDGRHVDRDRRRVDYDDRSRASRTRSRSRSPIRDRDPIRDRERDRDPYRR